MQRLITLLLFLTIWDTGLGLTSAQERDAVTKTERAVAAPASKQITPPSEKDQIGKRYALVIGNSDYKNVAKLNNPVNDAQAMCKTLRSLRFEVDCRVNLQHRGVFKEAISDFSRKIQPADVALFYFAGHGLELDGENYLVPTAADIRSKAYVEDEAVRVNFVFDELGIAKARLSIVILDACRDNPFSKVRSLSGNGLAIPNSIPSGSILIFPSAPGKPALDGNGENGVFTTHLLQHLPTTGITIEEMFKRVINGVRTDSLQIGQEQIPWMNLSFTGEFCFVGCGTRISAADYANVLKAKEEIEKNTLTLQNELAARETELQKFKVRMSVMQQQFESQQKSHNLSQSELTKLSQQRDELVARTANLQTQEQELKRVKTELERLQAQQVEFARRETEMALARDRIVLLERQIALQEFRKIGDGELQTLRRERDDLIKNNAELQKRQKNNEQAKFELEALQARLIEYDRQRAELDLYKNKLSQLEIDNRKKDESVRQMRAELESRQDALNALKERMVSLQQQMQTQRNNQRIATEEQERLQIERDELALKTQQLEARERDLQEARQALVRAEKLDNEQRAKQELAALQNRLSEYDRQKSELDGYKLQMARLEAEQLTMQVELKQERTRRVATEEKLKDAAKSTVKEAAFVPPAF
jgi:uncharacterized caspase-like protein